MVPIRVFLEYRTSNEIVVKCEVSNKPCEVIDYIYDQESLDGFVDTCKKNISENKDIFLCELVGNSWIAKTKQKLYMDINRPNDNFITYKNKKYSYNDILEMIDSGNYMIVTLYKK